MKLVPGLKNQKLNHVYMRKESLQEGIKEGAINTAKRMLADGILTLEKIAEYTGLPLDEVKKLKA